MNIVIILSLERGFKCIIPKDEKQKTEFDIDPMSTDIGLCLEPGKHLNLDDFNQFKSRSRRKRRRTRK